MNPLVIYHSPCLDGFTAAWACWLKHPDWEFFPGVYGEAPPDCIGRDVYLLDFSYKYSVMLDMYHVAKSITVLDHHKSAEADLAPMLADGWLAGKFDTSKSGARLAWEVFHPETPAPRMVLLVEDRDLGNVWSKAGPKYPDTRAVNAALFSYEYDFTLWSNLSEEMQRSSIDGPIGLDRFVIEGEAIERKQRKDIAELLAKTTRWLCFDKVRHWNVRVANLPYTLASDAGNKLAEGQPFAATYWVDKDGWYQFSLRSTEAGIDVSEIAKAYGGGGHKHAAGFRIKSLEDL